MHSLSSSWLSTMVKFLAFAIALVAGACYCDSSRIVGGDATTVERFPSIVQVDFLTGQTDTWNHNCGATILNQLYVLSAAHCFEPGAPIARWRRIRAGATYRNTGGTIIYVADVLNHPSYDPSTMNGDLSLVRLVTTLQYSSVVQPAGIIGQDVDIPDDSPVRHAGWGRTSHMGQISDVLREVTVFSVNHETCVERYRQIFLRVSANMICSGLLDVGGKGICQGDSGGPMYYGSNNALVGVISWGWDCAHATLPGISARIASYSDWIVENAR